MRQFGWFPWRQQSEPTAIGIGRPDGTFDAPFIDGWQELDSDVAARMYRNDMQLLFDFGAGSAIRGIKGTMANFARSSSAGWTWKRRSSSGAAHLILQPIQQELYNLLALAVQGHFEKAYRRWLQNSLQFVDGLDITESDILKAQWNNPTAPRRDLGEIMARIRGVHLKDTIEGPYLIELSLVSNVIAMEKGLRRC